MDDWKPGDLALCVNPEGQVVPGGIYTVAFVFFGSDDFEDGWALSFVEVPECVIEGEVSDGYDAWRFRKIAELTEAEHRAAIIELAADSRVPVEV